jgi:hypothetical protein
MHTEIEANDSPVLTCWKDIARYMGKGVRTVQRWEQEFGLPVRRPNGIDHKSAVIAYTRDLDAWLESNWSRRNDGNGVQAEDSHPRENLSELILSSQLLRHAHINLIHETTAALAALVNSCNELAVTRMTRHAQTSPPPGQL